MAQTKRKRQTKHRGNAAGVIEARGRTGRPPTADEKKRATRDQRREDRLNRQPTWKSSAQRALLAGAFMFVFLLITVHPKKGNRFVGAAIYAVMAMLLYMLLGYWLETYLWRRRMAKKQAARRKAMIDVAHVHGRPGAGELLLRAPPGRRCGGDRSTRARRPPVCSTRRTHLGSRRIDAILHHPLPLRSRGRGEGARTTRRARRYTCPELETRDAGQHRRVHACRASARSSATRPITRSPGARRSSLPVSRFDVRFTPGHSPGHVTYAVRDEDALLSGDVLFQGSVGRVDLPGGDWPTLLASIESLIDEFPRETTVYPGSHGRDHARRRARDESVPPRARLTRERPQQGRRRGDDPGAEGDL